MKLGIVLPTRNESANLLELVPKLHDLFPNALIIVVDDLSTDATVTVAKGFKCVVPYTLEVRDFGRSLIEGITKAWFEYGCDTVLQMDADHPIAPLQSFVEETDYDLVLGVEEGRRLSRGFACWMARKFLGLDFVHPTCGLRLWRKKALETINWRKIRARGFSVQIETLMRAKKRGLKIGEKFFYGKSHKPLPVRRVLEWLGTFFRLFLWRLWG